jgi:uncharacterized protein YkwD
MRTRFAFGLALLIGSLVPALASALTIDFSVANARGIPQAQVSAESPNRVYLTNGNGEVSISNLAPGQTVYFTRQHQASSDPCQATPEGQPGVAYTVPNSAPVAASVVLPALAFQPVEPGLSPRERGLVGLINNERRAHGLAPVVISSVLDEATDGYLNYIPASPASNTEAHCSLYGFWLRDLDAGYPLGKGGGENVALANSATQAFESWLSDAPHRENMLNPKWDAIGIANKGSTWVTDFQNTDPSFLNRAGWTGDYGDAALADTAQPAPAWSAGKSKRGHSGAPLNPRLTFKALRVRGHRLKLSVSIAPGAAAEGQLLVQLRHGHQHRFLRLSGLEAKSNLETGRWLVEARFQHGSKSEFLNTSVTRRVLIPKQRKGTRH